MKMREKKKIIYYKDQFLTFALIFLANFLSQSETTFVFEVVLDRIGF